MTKVEMLLATESFLVFKSKFVFELVIDLL